MKKRTVLCVLITAGICGAQSKRVPSTAEIEAVLTQVATFEHGRDPAPTVQLDEMVGRLSGSVELRSTVEKLLLKLIQSNATPAGKEVAFRQLSLVGSNASIPVVAPLLTEIDTAEVARFALAAIPGAAVDEALRKALTQAPSDRIRIGLINSLGRRRDTKAVPVISPMITPANLDVAAAGAAALASISDRSALAALAGIRKSATGPLRELVSEASVVCADHFAARGEKAVAVSVYKEMASPAEPSPIRTRALKSLGAADPKGAVPVLVAELQSSDSERQVIGIGLLNRIPGPEVTRAMLTEFAKLSPVGQVHLLTALSVRGDVAAKPTVLSAMKSNQPSVRAAALSALGRLGNGSDVKMLAESAAGAEEPEQSAARNSLYTLRGAGVDAAIVGGIGSSTGKVKAELIRATGERAAASASDALIAAARETDPDVRREALRASRNVGGAAQAPGLLDMLLKSSSAVERRDAAQTLATVLKRAQPAPSRRRDLGVQQRALA